MNLGTDEQQWVVTAGTQRSYAERLPVKAVAAKRAGVPIWLRCFEIAVSSAVLLAGLPIMIWEAWTIRRGTPGPALFFQQRLGANRRPFSFVKFRTLYHDARLRFPELYAYQYSDNELETFKFKIENDPRVTPQGRWLRRISLDELPNFWNVLTGDMALVGPRPEIPEMLPYYQGEMLDKFSVRPGITGLAQISGRGRLTFKDTVKYDVEYVRNRSFGLDLKILFTTVTRMMRDHGAF